MRRAGYRTSAVSVQAISLDRAWAQLADFRTDVEVERPYLPPAAVDSDPDDFSAATRATFVCRNPIDT